MISKKINLTLFKVKFFLSRLRSNFKKKNIRNHKYPNFYDLIKKKNFSTFWFLNNHKIFASFLPEDFNKIFRYLEIGSFEGMSALFVLSNWKNSKVTTVDTWKTSSDKSQKLDFNLSKVENNFDKNLKDFSFEKIKKKSEEALEFLKEKKRLFDIIYIDGSHNGKEILNDATKSFKILSPGGIIIFDDITNIYDGILMQPHEAFEKFYYKNKNFVKILYNKNIAVIQKINLDL